jgi:hypothetical protein
MTLNWDLAGQRTESSIQTNVVGLYRNGTQICAYAGPEELDSSVAAFGDSVHEVLRQLANRLVAQGVWIEVTDVREWHLEPLDPAAGAPTDLPHSAWGFPSCPGYLSAVTRGKEAQIICSECGVSLMSAHRTVSKKRSTG